jgi:hypothetical protein
MYDPNDPRASLVSNTQAAIPPTGGFAAADHARFYEQEPQESGPEGQTWYARGQNFLVAYTRAAVGASLNRENQPDEYVMLSPKNGPAIEVTTSEGTTKIPGNSIAIIPPGHSKVVVPDGGEIVRIFTTRSEDLVARCSNAESYAKPRPNIPTFEPWPEPPGGYRVRWYSLDVPQEPGRFGRIYRCTTLMVNVLDPQVGPRDITKLSPHHHDDFEQGSLALEGAFTHHLRWPWTTDMNNWRDDEHALCASPSLTIIPPPAIHTSRGMEQGVNQLVDIFCPPRIDFSEKPGWVLNADDYPMPKSQ